MSNFETRELKLRQLKAKRRRIVRLQKMILSLSLAAVICFSGAMKIIIDRGGTKYIAGKVGIQDPKTAVSPVQVLGKANTSLKEAASVALANSGTKIIAHRGYSAQAPENTLAAFELAAQNGTWGIETDICLTSDGQYVCMHDGALDRMTNSAGSIGNLSFEQVKAATIDAGAQVENYPNQKVPTLKEFLDLCKSYGINAVLDLKFNDPSKLEGLVQTVRDCGMEQASIILSGPDMLRRIRELSDKVQVQYLVGEATKEHIDQMVSIPRSGIDASSISPELIQYAKEQGLTVNVWTYNTAEDKAKWEDLDVDYLTTDNVNL